MITARDAAKLAAMPGRIKKVMEEAEESISAAAELGQYSASVTVPIDITDKVWSKLENLGFKVEMNNPKPGNPMSPGWKPLTENLLYVTWNASQVKDAW